MGLLSRNAKAVARAPGPCSSGLFEPPGSRGRQPTGSFRLNRLQRLRAVAQNLGQRIGKKLLAG
jgi:hypothetical protein